MNIEEVGYKINVQKAAEFLYANNRGQTNEEINPIYNCSKKVKIHGTEQQLR